MAKKIIVIITLIALVGEGLILPTPAEASPVSDVMRDCGASRVISQGLSNLLGRRVFSALGGTVPTSDAGATTASLQFKIETCVRAGLKVLEEIALATLKRRVLDAMVDQTINWINGGGRPQFYTDPEEFVRAAGQAAVGDVIQDIGLGNLCRPLRMPVLQFVAGGSAAGAPPFSQRISCTLDQVVGNVENFYQDFRSGQWVGFSEVWRPQNNYYGAILLAGDEIIERQSGREQAASNEIIANQGYNSTRECLEWTFYAIKDGQPFVLDYMSGANHSDPNAPPDINPASVPPDVTDPYWRCSRTSITTPGRTIAGVAERALTAHFDSVINANTFSDYAEALLGAAINRVIQVGVAGLKGTPAPSAPHLGYFELGQRGRSPENYIGSDGTNRTGIGDAGTNYTDTARNNQNSSSRINLLTQMNDINTALSNARTNLLDTSSTIPEVKNILTGFIDWCMLWGGSVTHPNHCNPLTDELGGVNALPAEIRQKLAAITPRVAEANNLRERVGIADAATLSDLQTEITALASAVVPLSQDAAEMADNILNQKQSLQTSFAGCQGSPTNGYNCD